jgi:acetyl esterase/lipase
MAPFLGATSASINYRLTDAAQWPGQIDDCYSAVRWLRDHGGEHGIHPNQIGAWGSSAGGHLVALMGTLRFPGDEKTFSRVQAVRDWFGPSDLLTMPPNTVGDGRTEEDVAQSNVALLLGATVYKVPDKANDASALHHVSKDDPPFLIMHGSEDPGVPLKQSKRLHRALNKAGVSSTFEIVEGAGHGGELFRTEAVQAVVLEFFTRQLKGKS